MSNAPPNNKAPLAIFFVLWGGFGLFFFFLGHHWGVEYDQKIEKISRGEVQPEMFEVREISSDGEDTYVRFRREHTDAIVTETGSARTITVGDKVKAYHFGNEWFIPEIHCGGHHWGKWIFLAFGLLPPMLTWIFMRRKEKQDVMKESEARTNPVVVEESREEHTPKILHNRIHRGENFTTGTSIFGAIFCSVFVIIGVCGFLWVENTTDKNVPQWVRYLFGVFTVVGALFTTRSIHTFNISRRRNELRRRHPNEFWKFDHEWQSEGAWEESSRAIRFALLFGTAWSVFLAPFFSLAANEDPVLYLFLAVFTLVPVGCVGYMVYALLRRAKFGRSYLRFERFPYFLGEEVSVAWKPGKPIGAFRSMRFTLRCIEEQQKTDSEGETTTQFAELFAQTIDVAQPGEKTDAAEVPLTFTVPQPPRPLGTQFSAKTPRYWELEVKADTPGIKYMANFLVPVYAPPRSKYRQ